jgi:hypothetical protein
MAPTADFFISYTQKDVKWASWIAWELQQANYTCVIQDRDFRPGQNFITLMRRGLAGSRHVIAVLSPDYFESQYANAELDAALAEDPRGALARLIPVRVRNCQLDPMLRGRIYIDLVNQERDSARQRLVAGIQAALSVITEKKPSKYVEVPDYPGDVEPQKPVLPPFGGKASARSAGKVRIMYVGMDVGRGLDLRGQFKQIGAALSNGAKRSRFSLKGYFDLTSDKLPDALHSEAPTIVHLSGNQSGGRVLMRDGDGDVTTFSDLALAGLLRSFDDSIRLAIIDTCNSHACARAAVGAIDLALGVRGYIDENAANIFYSKFYAALASGRSVASAAERGAAALQLVRVPKNEIPTLSVRRGIDATQVFFAGPKANCSQAAA